MSNFKRMNEDLSLMEALRLLYFVDSNVLRKPSYEEENFDYHHKVYLMY